MTLKASYAKKDDIPEALRSEYVEKDGKWVLDAEGMVGAEEFNSLKTKVDEFRSNNLTLAENLKKFEGKKVLSDEEQEEFDRLVSQEQEFKDKKLIDSGKIEELLASRTERMRADYEGKIKSLEKSYEDSSTEAKTNSQRLSKVMIRSEISKLLSDQGINPVKGAIDDIFARAGSVWRVDKNGKLVAQKENGETVFGGKGEPLSLQEWGNQLVKDAPYLFAANQGAGGSGNNNGGGGRDDSIIRIPRGDEQLKSKHIDDLASGKAVLVDG